MTPLAIGFIENINTGNILAQLIIFITLLALLSRYALNPLLGIMKKREDYINNEIKTAEQNKQDSIKIIEDQQKVLKQSQEEAKIIFENAKEQAEEQKSKIISTAKSEANYIKETALKEIQKEKELALDALKNQVFSLSLQIASKIIEKEINEEEQKRLIGNYLKEVGESR